MATGDNKEFQPRCFYNESRPKILGASASLSPATFPKL